MKQFVNNIKYECEYILDELRIKIKHPKRKGDLKFHCWRLCNHLLFHPWYCLKRGIKNLWNWFPIIWGTDVYDHCYLTSLMDKKMEEMEKFFLSDIPCNTRAKRDGKRIKWTRKLYKMWMDDHYSMLWYDTFKQRFPDSNKYKSNPVAWDEFGEPILFECKPMSDEEREFYRSGSDIAHKKDEKVYKLYIKGLSKLQFWWD